MSARGGASQDATAHEHVRAPFTQSTGANSPAQQRLEFTAEPMAITGSHERSCRSRERRSLLKLLPGTGSLVPGSLADALPELPPPDRTYVDLLPALRRVAERCTGRVRPGARRRHTCAAARTVDHRACARERTSAHGRERLTPPRQDHARPRLGSDAGARGCRIA